jgi:hypothetical protein
VDARPPARRPFFQIPLAIRTLLTVDDPRRYVIREMTSVSFVIKRELFDGPIPSGQFLKLKVELPLTPTPRTRDSRHTALGYVHRRIIGHTFI